LIVDDDPDDLFFLRRLLAKAKIPNNVVSFENPLGAIDYLELECRNPNPLFVPCAILTDLNMPGKNGFELTQWIRRHPRLKDARILMISDSEEPENEAKAKEAGANRFLRKFPTAPILRVALENLPCVAAPG
jgi:CheY-like chemotaxis protein